MGRHLDELSLSTDGRICPKARKIAEALDALEAKQPLRLEVKVVKLNPDYVVRLMAKVIVEAAVKRCTVHELDFAREGIDAILARRHFNEAMARARLIEPALSNIDVAAA